MRTVAALIGLAIMTTPAFAQDQRYHQYTLKISKAGAALLRLPEGPLYLANIPVCVISSAIAAQNLEGRRLTRDEGDVIALDCIIPIEGAGEFLVGSYPEFFAPPPFRVQRPATGNHVTRN